MTVTPQSSLGRAVAPRQAPLGSWAEVPAGTYTVGEPGEERRIAIAGFRIGRYPVTVDDFAVFTAATGRPSTSGPPGHPATGMTYAEARAYCEWAGARDGLAVRLPSADEWEVAARGPRALTWPWGDTFESERCACVESGWGWTVPVDAHPAGASPFGAEQMAGNVWEWVADPGPPGSWRTVRGGSYLDHAWGVRSSRSLAADPDRATSTTGFRLVAELIDDQRRHR